MPKKYRVAILMRQATQFDGPLFAKLVHNEQLELKIYYSLPGEDAVAAIDHEIGIRPDWAEMAASGYDYETPEIGMLGALRFLRKIVAGCPDLIIISGYTPYFHFLVALYAWLKRVPVGLRSDTTLQHSKSAGKLLNGLLKRFILPILLKIYSTVHPVGTLASEYLQHYGVDNEYVFPFPYAVNNGWFRTESSKHHDRRSELRREMGIAEDAFVVLGILKFNEREDPITLVLGVAELQKRHHGSIHLVLVGDGPLRGEIENTLRENGIVFMSLPGYAPYRELPKYYAVADVFVHPGVGESWGVSVNESMACGVPVVLSERVGAHVDLVREGDTGFVFKARDQKSLAGYLLTMAREPELCRTMGAHSRVLVEEWGYEATEKSLLEAVQKISL